MVRSSCYFWEQKKICSEYSLKKLNNKIMHCLSKRLKKYSCKKSTKKISNSRTCAIIFHYFSVAPYLTNIALQSVGFPRMCISLSARNIFACSLAVIVQVVLMASVTCCHSSHHTTGCQVYNKLKLYLCRSCNSYL